MFYFLETDLGSVNCCPVCFPVLVIVFTCPSLLLPNHRSALFSSSSVFKFSVKADTYSGVLATSSGPKFVLVSCPRTIVWLVNLKWAWLMRTRPRDVCCCGRALWGLPRCSALEFLVKCEMSWPERTLFFFLPPRENEHISLFLQSTYQPLLWPRFSWVVILVLSRVWCV